MTPSITMWLLIEIRCRSSGLQFLLKLAIMSLTRLVYWGASQASSPKTGHPLPTKVSSISTAENKAYSVIGFHEVTGSSTNGFSSTGKSGANFSLDALAKAKKALKKQKDLAEKLKKIPALNKALISSSVMTTRTVHGPVSSVTTSIASGPVASSKPLTTGAAVVSGLASIPNLEVVKHAQELAAKMGFRQCKFQVLEAVRRRRN